MRLDDNFPGLVDVTILLPYLHVRHSFREVIGVVILGRDDHFAFSVYEAVLVVDDDERESFVKREGFVKLGLDDGSSGLVNETILAINHHDGQAALEVFDSIELRRNDDLPGLINEAASWTQASRLHRRETFGEATGEIHLLQFDDHLTGLINQPATHSSPHVSQAF